MRTLIYGLLMLFATVCLALIAKQYPGYVLIDVGGWTVETTLVLALLLIVIVFVAIYYVLRIFSGLWRMPREFQQWQSIRQAQRSHEALTRGLIELAEGKWQAAEKSVLKFARHGQVSLLNYLAAARAAQGQGAYDRRDAYLRDAHQQMPSADIAIDLTQAELQLNQGQLEQALASLRRLQQLSPKHRQILNMLALLYAELKDWASLIDLFPELRRRNALPAEQLERLEESAYLALLQQVPAKNHKALVDFWYRVPQRVQQKSLVLAPFIKALIESDGGDLAEPMLRNALKREWNESLVNYYGRVKAVDSKSQLSHAESWLAKHPNNPTLLLCLGRLSLRAGLWGKARGYLEASIGAGHLAEAYNELGHLLDKLGETDAARRYFREGLKHTPGCEQSVPIKMSKAELEHNKPPKPPSLIASGS